VRNGESQANTTFVVGMIQILATKACEKYNMLADCYKKLDTTQTLSLRQD
jgi:ribosomal protein S4E